ncbi:MAG: ABC transporter permease [Coriobacteriales bacterium]|nr:ABC transporter permease [Coriobacteriales bacterium]
MTGLTRNKGSEWEMNFAKRAALSIVRRPGKTLILFLVILIIGNLIAGTVAVRQAIIQSEEMAKRSLGASVSFGIDDQALMKAYDAGKEPEVGAIDASFIEELGSRPEVKSFDYSLSTYLPAASLKNYQPGPEEGGGVIIGGPDGYKAYFNLCGVHHAPVLAIEEGKLSLVEGRVFSEDDIAEGRLVTLISDKFAETNALHVGDTISLSNEIRDYSEVAVAGAVAVGAEGAQDGKLVDSHEVVLEVIGIFALNSGYGTAETGGDGEGLSVGQPTDGIAEMFDYEIYNTLYTPIKVVQAEDRFQWDGYEKLMRETGDDELLDALPTDYQPYYSPVYLLNSIDDIESFEDAVSASLPDYYTVLSAQSEFEDIAGVMSDIQQVVAAALIVLSIAALVIISLVIVLFLRDRRKEFGIYLSLGVRKPVIVGQVLLEVLIIAVLALGISLFTGNLISGSISQQMIGSQLIAEDAGGMYASASISMGNDMGLLMGDLTPEDVVENYQVQFSMTYVLSFLGLSIGVVVLSCIVPLLYVLRLRPRKILM